MAEIGDQRRAIVANRTYAFPTGAKLLDGLALTHPALIPLTEEARRALGGKAFVNCSHFPFKVGREGRKPGAVSRLASAVDRRLRFMPQLNDAYLLEVDSSEGFHISREHFLIERTDSGFVLVDRNSACGTWVGDEAVGGGQGRMDTELRNGDVIVIGNLDSPYRFSFRLPD